MYRRMLNSRSFKKWLDGRARWERAGKAYRVGLCPIATYIREGLGLRRVRVDNTSIHADDGDENYIQSLQPWARRFVRAIDRFPSGAEITVGEALELFDEVMIPPRTLRSRCPIGTPEHR